MIITTITEVLWRAKKKKENKEKGKEEEEGGSKFWRGITIWTEEEELGSFSLFFLFFLGLLLYSTFNIYARKDG